MSTEREPPPSGQASADPAAQAAAPSPPSFEDLATTQPLLHFNGLNCATGRYGIEPLTAAALAARLSGQGAPDNLDALNARRERAYPLKQGLDPKRIDHCGWAAIFTEGADPALLEALSPLLKLREAQTGSRFRVFFGKSGRDGKSKSNAGYRQGESLSDFIAARKVSQGVADPDEMGYYVLIVGSPEEIPFSFQHHMDVNRGVGRLHFDSLQDYESYARSVVECESGRVKLPRRLVIFGPQNEDDPSTDLSSRYLIRPLLPKLPNNLALPTWAPGLEGRAQPKLNWNVDTVLGDAAKKSKLLSHLSGDDTPALLFTATHGAEFPLGDARLLPHQGALVCQDWPGPERHRGEIPQDFYVAGDDIKANAKLLGLISFHFACFGGGSTRLDQFAAQSGRDKRVQIAPKDFVAELPRRLLAHPAGGALATIAHVERTWGYSFLSPNGLTQTAMFESVLTQLMAGTPIGWVTEVINLRYAEWAAQLSDALTDLRFDPASVDPYKLAEIWTLSNDLRSNIILGDPAVRVPLALDENTSRPTLVAEVQSEAGRASPGPAAAPPSAGPAVARNSETPQPFGSNEQLRTASRPTGEEGAAEVLRGPADVAGASFGASAGGGSSGLLDTLRRGIGNFAGQVAAGLSDLASLDVRTYAVEEFSDVRYDPATKTVSGAHLRAFTHISFDGDIDQCVPLLQTEEDQALWQRHLEGVRLAQQNRAEFMRSMAELAVKLIGMISPT
jgi:hypothetical protein